MQRSYTVPCWRTVDLSFHTRAVFENPFGDVDVFADFTGPQGQRLRLNAFWNGGDEWVARFAPTAPGLWRCTVESSVPGAFGGGAEVRCVPYGGPLDLYRHGFVRVSADRTHLEHADGTPFFWLGDTHWTFLTEERFAESNCPRYQSQFKACVDRRAAQRFTVYQCNFRDGASDGFFGKNIDLMHDTGHGFLPDVERFKTDVDAKMLYLADAGLLIAVGYAWFYDMASGGPERYRALAKYTAARYGALPVVWTLAGEVPGYLGDKAENARLWGEVARECARWNVYGAPQSAHLACARPFPRLYTDEPWFGFAMSQAGHGDFDMDPAMYERFRADYAGHPVLESEGLYEGAASGELSSRPITPAMLRRLAYLCFQAGGCGYTYGALGLWELQWEAGAGGIGWGDLAWYDGLELPGAGQLTLLRDFYEEAGWSTLRPLPAEAAETRSFFGPADSRTRIWFTADAARETLVGYLPETAARSFVLRGLPAGRYAGFWMDPETGARQPFGPAEPTDGVLEGSAPAGYPARRDLLLLARRA